MSDDSTRLVELFRVEAGEHAAAFDEGLVALERDAASTGAVMMLERAAHTLRGAAQVVGLAEVARLTQAVERCLGDLPRGVALAGRVIAALRRAQALLADLATVEPSDLLEWEARRGEELEEVTRSLRTVAREPRGERGAAVPVVEPTAPTAPPASSGDVEMLALFRVEVEGQAAVLTEGLLALERDPSHPEGVEALMRAAHSLKGAARILDLDPAVKLSHVMEDHLVAVGAGRLPMTSAAADVLLAATDQLLQLAQSPLEWLAAHADDMLALTQRVSRLRHEGRATATTAASASAESPRVGAPASRAAPLERVVRIRAAHLDRLMGLAGESLVEARRLQPLASSVHRLIKQQQGIFELIDELGAAAGVPTPPARVAELVQRAKASALELRQHIAQRSGDLESHARRSEDLTRRLYGEAIASRMRPFADGVRGFPRLVRDLARTLGKQVELVITGEEVDVDRDILERIEAPLNHMLRNALDHGIEPAAARVAAGKPERATLRLEARHWAGMLTVTVADDGRGIDPEQVRRKIVERGLAGAAAAAALSESAVLDWLFRPGFSTTDEVSLVSGRGVGLDVVRSVVQEMGGTVRLTSEPGKGTSFLLQLPITLSVQRAVVVEIAGEAYAFPMLRIERLCSLAADDVLTLEGRPFFSLEGRNVALVTAAQVLELDGAAARDPLCVVVIGERHAPCGVIVDRFLGEQDLVVRPLDRRLGKVADISAAAILADGTPLLILDVDDMNRSIMHLQQGGLVGTIAAAGAGAAARARKRVLVVDDSISVRELERQVLANRGYDVAIAVDGRDAWETLRGSEFDLVITDVDMPRMDGIELTRSIKQDGRLRGIPVMIVSYRDLEEDRLRGLDAGANHYLAKSNFHDDTLVQAVNDLIGAAESAA